MKIGREDFEALIKGEKNITPYIELDPDAGSYSVFGVKTASKISGSMLSPHLESG